MLLTLAKRLRKWNDRPTKPAAGRGTARHFRRPRLERLEDRTLLSAPDYAQVPRALDTILTDLNNAVNQQVWAASPTLPVVGSALHTSTPPAALQFLTSTIQASLDAQFTNSDPSPPSFQAVENDIATALGARVQNIQVVSKDSSTNDPSQADDVEFQVTIHQDTTVLAGVTPPLDLDLPQMGLTLQSPPPVSIQYGYTFQLNFGVNQNDVYVDTGPSPELTIQLAASAESFPPVNANLGPVALTVSDGNIPGTNLKAAFRLDLTNGPVSVNGTLNGDPAYLARNSTAGVSGEGLLSLEIRLATSGFPTISGDLSIDWPFNGDPSTGAAPSVALNDVEVEASSFLQSAVGPVVGDIQEALKPLKPVVDILDTPIPIISSLPGLNGLTLASFIDSGANTGGSVQSFVNTFNAIAGLANYQANGSIKLGDYMFPASYDPRAMPLGAVSPK